jgi:hypothetical protein
MKVYVKRKYIHPSEMEHMNPCKGCYFADNKCVYKDKFLCQDEFNDYIFKEVKHKEQQK